MAYAGETLQKKLARAIAYELAARESASTDGGIVCLAGPEAHDLGPISHFFPGVPADKILFVDTDAAGLAVAESRLPGIRTHHGPLDEAEIPWPVKCAVLDFCGHLVGSNLSGAAHVMKRLAFGGTVLLTTLRARETSGAAHRLIHSRRHQAHDRNNMRVGANTQVLANAIGLHAVFGGDPNVPMPLVRRVLGHIGTVKYNTPVSPMLITVSRLERLIDGVRRRELRTKAYDILASMDTECIPAADDMSGETVQWRSIPNTHLVSRTHGPSQLVSAGYPAAAYDISPGTLAAWKAHQTMGTYDEVA